MRFCNESANIGTFWELTTKPHKNIPYNFILSGKDSEDIHFRSNSRVSNDIGP